MTGRAIRTQLANGTLTSMAYDAAGRETQITHFTSGSTPFSSFADTYNAAGNRTQRINLDGDVTTWTYDSTAQVLSERSTDSLGTLITTFAYDAVGNRLIEDEDSNITTSVYDAANRLQTSETISGTTTYTYDKNGNQTSIEDPASDITTYVWTYENQLAEIESPNGDLVTYTYAPVNRKSDELRLSKETDLEFTSYLWDDQNIILEQDEVGTVDAEYTVMPQAYGNLISQTRDAESSFYHFDPLGSTRELTDETETVTDSYLYSVFGKVKSSTGTTVNPYQWVGQEGYYRDPESGLYSLRNRFYDSNEGRFKSEDPLGFAAGDSDFYRYVGNNAATLTDPSGFDPLRNTIYRDNPPNTPTNRALEIVCHCNWRGNKNKKIVRKVSATVPIGGTITGTCRNVCDKRYSDYSGIYRISSGSASQGSGTDEACESECRSNGANLTRAEAEEIQLLLGQSQQDRIYESWELFFDPQCTTFQCTQQQSEKSGSIDLRSFLDLVRSSSQCQTAEPNKPTLYEDGTPIPPYLGPTPPPQKNPHGGLVIGGTIRLDQPGGDWFGETPGIDLPIEGCGSYFYRWLGDNGILYTVDYPSGRITQINDLGYTGLSIGRNKLAEAIGPPPEACEAEEAHIRYQIAYLQYHGRNAEAAMLKFDTAIAMVGGGKRSGSCVRARPASRPIPSGSRLRRTPQVNAGSRGSGSPKSRRQTRSNCGSPRKGKNTRNTSKWTTKDFPGVGTKISQKQLRHIKGRPEYRGGGYFDNVADAQKVLDAFHSGAAKIIGKTSQGFPVVRYLGVTGTNVNVSAGFPNQPTNVFIIKGTTSTSVVPANPNWGGS